MTASPQTAASKPGASSPPALEITELTDRNGLAALRTEWSDLFTRCPQASPFQSPEWLLAWTQGFLHEGLWVLAMRRSGVLVGLAPFFIYRDPEGGRQVTLLGNGMSDRLDLLATPDDAQEVAQAVLSCLAARRRLWDRCDFRDLPPEAALLGPALPLASADDRTEADTPCPVLVLPHSVDAVVAGLPRKRRENIRRRARRLAEAGHVAFETADAGALDEHLEAVMRLHARRWETRGEDGMLAKAAVRRFLEAAADGLLARGLLRLDVLRLDGRIIAAHYGFRRKQRSYSYLHGFDPEFAAFAPVSLLIARILEHAVAEGVREFDFLRGCEPYKYDWGANDRPQFRRRIWR